MLHNFNTVKMTGFLIATLLVNLCSGATIGMIGTKSTNTTLPQCPPSKQGLKYGGKFPELPVINVTAEVLRHGFCTLPNGFEDFQRRLKWDPDTKLDASGLISSQGYPVEEFEVSTDDGFLLGMQRIPHGVNNSHFTGPRPAVLLQHGLLACSTNWVSNEANESLGFILADAGYDVWLGNVRGNTYSRYNRYWQRWKKAWDWSWDQMAEYDLPAMVEHILKVTGHKQISYVGHSQGTTMAFAGLSISKDLQSKINLCVALAPVAYASHMTSDARLLAPPQVQDPIMGTLEFFHHYQILPDRWIFDYFANTFCDRKRTVILCQSVLFLFAGYSCQHMNADRLPVYISNNPAGTSIYNLQHWAQLINSGQFAMFDHGCEGNVKLYGQTTPPLYRVQDIDIPVAIFAGGIDILADPADVNLLVPQLKNVTFLKEIDSYGHLDFVWAQDAHDYVYKDVVKLLNEVWQKTKVDESIVEPLVL